MNRTLIAMIAVPLLAACASQQPDSGSSAASPVERVHWVAYGTVESIQRTGPDSPQGASVFPDRVSIGVRLDDGRLYSVVQETADGVILGQRARVEDGRRVMPVSP